MPLCVAARRRGCESRARICLSVPSAASGGKRRWHNDAGVVAVTHTSRMRAHASLGTGLAEAWTAVAGPAERTATQEQWPADDHVNSDTEQRRGRGYQGEEESRRSAHCAMFRRVACVAFVRSIPESITPRKRKHLRIALPDVGSSVQIWTNPLPAGASLMAISTLLSRLDRDPPRRAVSCAVCFPCAVLRSCVLLRLPPLAVPGGPPLFPPDASLLPIRRPFRIARGVGMGCRFSLRPGDSIALSDRPRLCPASSSAPSMRRRRRPL